MILAGCSFTAPNILFYGRVVDQYGEPVKKTHVYYQASSAFLSEGGGRGRTYTDDQGYFVINSHGVSLELWGIRTPGIDRIHFPTPTEIGRQYYSNMQGTIHFIRGKDPSGKALDWRFFSAKENAYLMHAWRLGDYAGAKRSYVPAKLIPDGRIYTLRLTELNWRKKRVFEGKQDGQFYISCTRPSKFEKNNLPDWQMILTPVEGGLQETTDLYMNQAPENGYQDGLSVHMKRAEPSYRDRFHNKRYYFKTNLDTIFGNLFFEVAPFASQDYCILRMHYTINPYGSRNLELEQKQRN